MGDFCNSKKFIKLQFIKMHTRVYCDICSPFIIKTMLLLFAHRDANASIKFTKLLQTLFHSSIHRLLVWFNLKK